MKKFTYTTEVNLTQLQNEIQNSFITIAIDEIYIEESVTVIIFKADLSEPESVMLTSIIDAHEPIPFVEEQAQLVKLGAATNEDGIPYVYSTSKPLGHYVCFQGADDCVPENEIANHSGHFSEPSIPLIGNGKKLTFNLTSTQKSVTKDFQFNQNVYVKDGYMITQGAPFGSCFDIEIIHPVHGLLFPFGKKVPILGTGWFPMDTEDRGYIPKGLIIRITMFNSQFEEDEYMDNEEDSPSTFRMAGRFELYRPKPLGT